MKNVVAILLVLCICFCMCACNDADLDDRNNKVHTNSNSTQDDADPNGFATKEALVDAYFNMYYIEVVEKEEFRKIYTEQSWTYRGGESVFEKAYEQYKKSAENCINNTKERLGSEYQLHCEIVDVEDSTNYYEYSDEERQECLEMFGVEPEEHFMYTLTVSITGVGSDDEFTDRRQMVTVRRIAGKWYLY